MSKVSKDPERLLHTFFGWERTAPEAVLILLNQSQYGYLSSDEQIKAVQKLLNKVRRALLKSGEGVIGPEVGEKGITRFEYLGQSWVQIWEVIEPVLRSSPVSQGWRVERRASPDAAPELLVNL